MLRSALVAVLTLVVALAGPAGAALRPAAEAGAAARGSALASGPGPGYVATDNVEWLGTIPLNTDSAGARVHGDRFYITDDRGITIYDISDPELPLPLGYLPLPQGPYYVEEDVDTNGEILLLGSLGDLVPSVGGVTRQLHVVDVSDPARPALIGSVAGGDEHTISCVLDCTWAWGSAGVVVDLRDPTKPTVAGRWTNAPEVVAAGVRGSHDVTEVAPGIVLTSSNPALLLDARTDPVNPTVIGRGTFPDRRFVHGNLWPYHGDVGFDDPSYAFDPADFDDLALVGGETLSLPSTCSEDDGAFMTMRATEDEATGDVTFTLLDEYRVSGTNPLEGGSPYDQYCAHWFTAHDTFDGGGLVAMGWYEHGVRFLDVADGSGEISEVGWFLPLGGSTSAAYWITDEILYTADYQRGIDILRFTGEPATGEVTVAGPAFERAPDPRPAWVREALRSTPYACPLPGA